MEVTKDEQRKLDDLFRKIAARDEFVAQQRQAAETLRRKYAEPPVTVWAVVDRYTLRDWGQEGFGICGVYLTLDEAVAHIHAERDRHTSEGPLLPIEGKGENTRWDYSDWDTAHNYGIEQATILSTFKTDGQPLLEDSVIFQKGVAEGRRLERQDNAKWSEEDEKMREEVLHSLVILRSNIEQSCGDVFEHYKLINNIEKQRSWLESLKNKGNSPKSSANSPIKEGQR